MANTEPTVESLLQTFVHPAWSTPAGVRSIVTTRDGGVSDGPYGLDGGVAGGLNLGLHTGDTAAHVHANRARLRAIVGERRIAWLDQCHGIETVAGSEAIAALDAGQALSADAVLSDRLDEVCAIMVADCLPVLICDARGRAVGAAHAGWRGLCAGVLERAVARLERLSGGGPMLAYLGPSIGPGAFEVGAEVRAAFIDAALPSERDATNAAFVPASSGATTKYLGDLPALARLRLGRQGVMAVHGGTRCTVNDARHFYSYRRDRTTGRFAALIWREMPDIPRSAP